MSDVDSLDDGQFYEFADDAAFPASGELVPVNYSDVSAMVMPGAPRAYRLRAYRRRRRARQLGCARRAGRAPESRHRRRIGGRQLPAAVGSRPYAAARAVARVVRRTRLAAAARLRPQRRVSRYGAAAAR